MKNKRVSIGESVVTYVEYDGGKVPLLCFNGYGRTASEFSQLHEAFSDDYSMIAVNVHLHGEADWSIEPGEERVFLESLLNSLGLNDKGFAVLGYSIGARIAMRIATEFPEKVKEIILLAPDGVYSPPIFQYANKTRAGRIWMNRLVKKPGLILTTLKILSKIGVYSDVVYKFYYNRFNSVEKRSKLKRVWRIMSEMTPESAAVDAILKKNELKWTVILGKYDNVIHRRKVYRRFKGHDQVRFLEIPVNHSFLNKETARFIKELL